MRVATLVASPGALTPALAERAARAVGSRNVYALADGTASDLVLPDGTETDAALRSALMHALDGAPVDVVVQGQDARRKRMLIADMDSTIIEQECIDELAAETGFGAEVAAITAAAMRGELDFAEALRARVALLKGLPTDTIARVLRERIRLRAGAKTLLRTMRAGGAWCALVSGGFTAFAGAIARDVGFDEHRANVLLEAGGRLTGAVREPILGATSKEEALREIAVGKGLRTDDVLAVGDGANDLPMLRLAGTGVALHAKPRVAEAARHRIDHGDLTALLFIQGYRARDFR